MPAAAAYLKAQGYGRVINIGSLLSVLGMAERTPYAVSKGGVLQLTRVLGLEWALAGITVNCIIPGVFATEMNRPLLDDPEINAGVVAKVPMGRWGEPPEIAGLALYLASDAASYVTGAGADRRRRLERALSEQPEHPVPGGRSTAARTASSRTAWCALPPPDRGLHTLPARFWALADARRGDLTRRFVSANLVFVSHANDYIKPARPTQQEP